MPRQTKRLDGIHGKKPISYKDELERLHLQELNFEKYERLMQVIDAHIIDTLTDLFGDDHLWLSKK